MTCSEQSAKVRDGKRLISFCTQDIPVSQLLRECHHAQVQGLHQNPQYHGVEVEAHLEVCYGDANPLATKSKAIKTKITKIFQYFVFYT